MCVSLRVGSPNWTQDSRDWFNFWVEGKNHMPGLAGDTVTGKQWIPGYHLCNKDTLLVYVQFVVHQGPQVLSYQAFYILSIQCAGPFYWWICSCCYYNKLFYKIYLKSHKKILFGTVVWAQLSKLSVLHYLRSPRVSKTHKLRWKFWHRKKMKFATYCRTRWKPGENLSWHWMFYATLTRSIPMKEMSVQNLRFHLQENTLKTIFSLFYTHSYFWPFSFPPSTNELHTV